MRQRLGRSAVRVTLALLAVALVFAYAKGSPADLVAVASVGGHVSLYRRPSLRGGPIVDGDPFMTRFVAGLFSSNWSPPTTVEHVWRDFSYFSFVDGQSVDRRVEVPEWFVDGVLALPLVAYGAWLVREQVYGRRGGRRGSCHACGYDLRATPDRCPECGTVPTK